MATRENGTPWWTAFPEPKSTPTHISPSSVMKLLDEQQLKSGQGSKKEFLLVDVRRNDCEGGTISTSLNMPAHSFYHTRKSLYDLCAQAGIKLLVFYCGE